MHMSSWSSESGAENTCRIVTTARDGLATANASSRQTAKVAEKLRRMPGVTKFSTSPQSECPETAFLRPTLRSRSSRHI